VNPASAEFTAYELRSCVRDDELACVDFDLESLVRHESGLLEPSARELEPRHERWCGPSARRVGSPAGRLLNRDAARGVSVVKCFKIGVSHIDS